MNDYRNVPAVAVVTRWLQHNPDNWPASHEDSMLAKEAPWPAFEAAVRRYFLNSKRDFKEVSGGELGGGSGATSSATRTAARARRVNLARAVALRRGRTEYQGAEFEVLDQHSSQLSETIGGIVDEWKDDVWMSQYVSLLRLCWADH